MVDWLNKMGKKKHKFEVQVELCPHNSTIEKITEDLQTDVKFGLRHEIVEVRLEKYGTNVIPKVKGSIWEVYVAPLLNWLINIYLIVALNIQCNHCTDHRHD